MQHEPEYIKSRHGMFYARWGFILIAFFAAIDLGNFFKISSLISMIGGISGYLWLEIGFYRILTKTRTYNKHDRKILDEFIQLSYLRESVEFVREHDFRHRHARDSVEGLLTFNEVYANDPNKQFIGEEVGGFYTEFKDSVSKFVEEIAQKTYPHDVFHNMNEVYKRPGDKDLEDRFETDTKSINDSGREMVSSYDKFLKDSKEVLFADD